MGANLYAWQSHGFSRQDPASSFHLKRQNRRTATTAVARIWVRGGKIMGFVARSVTGPIKLPLCFSLLRRTQLKIHAASHLRYEVVARVGLGTTERLSERATGNPVLLGQSAEVRGQLVAERKNMRW